MDFTENGKFYRLIKQGPDIASPEGVMVALFHKTNPKYIKLFEKLVAPGQTEETVVNEAKLEMKKHSLSL